jgi:hypothetical protein
MHRKHILSAGTFVFVAFCVLVPHSTPAREVSYGLFGSRTLGRPLTPGARTRFDSGIRRGPSGSFLGLQRADRFPDRQRPARTPARPPRRLTPAPQVTPSVPPSVQPAPPRIERRPVPFRTRRPTPRREPADIWFRTR